MQENTQHFGNRLSKIIDLLGITQSELADYVGLSRQAVAAWLDKEFLSDTVRKKLSPLGKAYPVNMSYLYHGHGEPILENHPKFDMYFNTPDKPDPITGSKPVPFFDIEVLGTVAESLSDAIPIHPDGYLEIPFFKRADFVVPVSGESMKGKYNHGDWIAVRRIRNRDFIIYGEAYMIVTKSDNYRTVKYLKQDQDDPDNLVLIPYNIEQFEPQVIPKAEIRELFIVLGVVRPN